MVEEVKWDWQQRQDLKESWAKFLERFEFDCFFTLTYRAPATSAILSIDRASRLLGKFYDSLKIPLQSFIVAEQHESGTYHAHGLLRLGTLNKENQVLLCRALWKAGWQKYGRCSFELIRSSEDVRAYVGKYLTKRVADHRFVGKFKN